MNLPARRWSRPDGFTLAELLVGMAVGSVTLGAVALTSVSLQRSFEAANYQMTAQNDQLRVLDYLSRDLHLASAVTILNDGEKISVTLPSTSTTSIQLDLGPVVGSLRSGSSGATTVQTVSYYVEGGELIRDVDGIQTNLADTVADAQFTQSGSFVTVSILFTPRFSTSVSTARQQATRASSCVYLRNLTLAN